MQFLQFSRGVSVCDETFTVNVVKSLHQKVHMLEVALKYVLKMAYTWGDYSYMENTEIYLKFTGHQ